MKKEHRRTHKKRVSGQPEDVGVKEKKIIRISAATECVRDISLRNDKTRGEKNK